MRGIWKKGVSLVAAAALALGLGAPLTAQAAEENIFLHKDATASSYQAANPPANAVDGDETGTRWCAQPSSSQQQNPDDVSTHWIQIDLGADYALEEVRFVLEDNGIDANGAVYRYRIAVSRDAEITAEDVVVDESENTEIIKTVDASLNGAVGRYVRIYLNCATPRNWPSIMEISGTGTLWTAPAQSAGLTLDYSGTVQPGGSFAVPVRLTGLEALTAPLYAAQLALTYPDGVTCTGVTLNEAAAGTLTDFVDDGAHTCTILYDADSFDTGLPAGTDPFFTAYFTVDADAQAGSYPLNVAEGALFLTTEADALELQITPAQVEVGSGQVTPEGLTFTLDGPDWAWQDSRIPYEISAQGGVDGLEAIRLSVNISGAAGTLDAADFEALGAYTILEYAARDRADGSVTYHIVLSYDLEGDPDAQADGPVLRLYVDAADGADSVTVTLEDLDTNSGPQAQVGADDTVTTRLRLDGDVNGDGRVTIDDIADAQDSYQLRQGDAGWDAQAEQADVTGDGVVNLEDLVYIAQLYLDQMLAGVGV